MRNKKQTPARLALRLPRDLHARAVRNAASNGISLNTWMIIALVQTLERDALSEEETQQMLALVNNVLGPKKAEIWWQTCNPMLGNLSPISMLARGCARRLFRYVKLQNWLSQSNEGLALEQEQSHS